MAEAYARELGADVLEAASGGVHAAGYIPGEVVTVMEEEGISLEGQHSKSLEKAYGRGVDLIVSLLVGELPDLGGVPVRCRAVSDPIGGRLRDYRRTRDTVRCEVEALIAELRQA